MDLLPNYIEKFVFPLFFHSLSISFAVCTLSHYASELIQECLHKRTYVLDKVALMYAVERVSNLENEIKKIAPLFR